jgi:D-alanyl-D-alanine carboxypeptidase
MLKGSNSLARPRTRSFRHAIAALLLAGATLASATADASAAPKSAIVVDAKTGKVLFAQDPDGLRHPASLTKMMTLFILFETLDSGKLSMASRLNVSAFASRQSPTKLGLRAGSTISVRDAMLGIITKSANDAAVVVAENLGGSEAAFAQRMTATAREIGMTRTTFRNASGLPNNDQWTTARDMTTLGRALQDRFPNYYRNFATRSFVFNGRVVNGHNHLLDRVAGADGIKTGYTNASGFNLVSSVKRNNRALVATVMGGPSARARDTQMVGLLEKYIPVAYAGPRTAPILVAKGRPMPQSLEPAPAEVTETASLQPAPQPRLRPRVKETIVASVAPTTPDVTAFAPAESSPTAAEGPKMVFNVGPSARGVARPIVETASITGPVPTADDMSETAQADPQGDTEDGGSDRPSSKQTTAAIAEGWKIQIAAAPSQGGAQAMLDNAKSKGNKMLASATPSIEPVTKGDATFYRARFTGFATKDQARAACAYLTKKDVSCLAVRQ